MKNCEQFNELESDRLFFRKVCLSDTEAVFEIGSDLEVLKFFPWKPHDELHDSEVMIEKILSKYQKGEFTTWAIEEKCDKKLIGLIYFVKIEEKNSTLEIVYVLNRHSWGKGFITEALTRLVKFAFEVLEVNKIQIGHIKGNIGSQRVIEKAKFTFEGVSREHILLNGQYQDVCNYSMLKSEFINNGIY